MESGNGGTGLFDRLVVESLRDAWRAASSDGQLAFTSAMLCFGIAAFAFHLALMPQTERERHLESTAAHKQESLEGEEYPVLASLVLPSRPGQAPGQQSYLCQNTPDAARIREALAHAVAQIEKRATESGSDALAAVCPFTPDDFGPLGPAWANEASIASPNTAPSTLFIPSTLALDINRTCRGCGPDGSGAERRCTPSDIEDLAKHYDRFITRSRALEAPGLLKAITNEFDGTGFARVTAYVVSPEGLTRGVPTVSPRDFDAHYANNGASYVFHTLEHTSGDACARFASAGGGSDGAADAEGLKGYITYPYLDLNGGGVVETYCTVLESGSAKLVDGVLCFDLAHTESKVLETLRSGTAALDLSVVRLQSCDEEPDPPWLGECDVKTCEEANFPNDGDSRGCPDGLRSWDDRNRLRMFARWYYHLAIKKRQLRQGGVLVEHRTDDERGGAKPFENDRMFGVVVFHHPDPNDLHREYYDIAIGRLRRSRARDYFALFVCALASGIAVCILVVSYRRRMRRREGYLARGLGYGVLQIGKQGQILGANDRAEAVLGLELPRLGIQSAKRRIHNTFAPLIDDRHCVAIPLLGPPTDECIVPYEKIRERSIDGLTTDFYAYLTSTQEWLRISTRIVVLPNQEEQLFYAIDAHVCDEHAAILEGFHVQH